MDKIEKGDNLPPIVYPRVPYHNDNTNRRLSRMNRKDRLLTKAIARSMKPMKGKYINSVGNYLISAKGKEEHRTNHLPKEWR